MKTTFYTRQQYLNGDVDHNTFFSQFLDKETEKELLNNISLDEINKSTDEHMNDIPMKKWDMISNFNWQIIRGEEKLISTPVIRKELADMIKATGENLSSSTMVCIYKAQARKLKNL